MRILLVLIFVMLLVAPVFAESFPKSRNYMSERGYARWQSYLQTGRWPIL